MRLNLYDNVVTNYKDKDGARGWKAVSDVLRMAKDLEYLDLSACMLESDGCGNAFTEVHCKTLRGLSTSKLSSLATLDLSGNEDLEDNVDISAIAEILESRAGGLILEELDEDADDGAQDSEEQEPEAQKVADASVDELTDLIESQLTFQGTNYNR
ncbi:hypothetical protein B0H14DRAFT_3473156 [Mycena olivaceomarginata]|nr:hypothetical protein B0H14DRAFT_3473156 [Mycena olivaceomarginata]